MKKNPIAILTSDVHYSLPNLQLADTSMRLAIAKSNELGVPLIVAGDLHDTKANLRGECIIAMRETFKLAELRPIVLIGNHDKINEKSSDHALTFLEDLVTLITAPTVNVDLGLVLIPYEHDLEFLRDYLVFLHTDFFLIMHQGISGSNAGEYIQDKTALGKFDVAGRRVISGHYHSRQDIALPDGGLWSYIGNPFTVNYAEANDLPKGFRILNDDGSLDFVPTNLRKHVVIEAIATVDDLHAVSELKLRSPNDLIWVKIRGTKEALAGLTKPDVAHDLGLPIVGDFRLDLIPHETKTEAPEVKENMSQGEILDSLIQSLSETSDERKERLKTLWKELK